MTALDWLKAGIGSVALLLWLYGMALFVLSLPEAAPLGG